MGGFSNQMQGMQGRSFAEKLGSSQVRDVIFGPDFAKNAEFAQAHPDSAPPAKRQSYDDFTKAYGDAHPVKAEPAQGLPAPSASSASTPSVPAAPQVQQPTTYSAPQGMMNASAPKAPGAAAAGGPATTSTSLTDTRSSSLTVSSLASSTGTSGGISS